MTSLKIIAGVVITVIAGVAIYGAYQYPQNSASFGSSVGSTFETAKYAGVTINLATPGVGATSTSIINTDASARYITATRIGCNAVGTSLTAYTGAALASLQVSVGTTTAVNPTTFSYNFAVVLNQNNGTGTAATIFASSTTQTATSENATYWGPGVPLTFWWNATNTAVCTEGVDYIGS